MAAARCPRELRGQRRENPSGCSAAGRLLALPRPSTATAIAVGNPTAQTFGLPAEPLFARPKGAEKGGCHCSGRRRTGTENPVIQSDVGLNPCHVAEHRRRRWMSRRAAPSEAGMPKPLQSGQDGPSAGAISFRRFSLGEQRKSARPAGRKLPQHAADLQQGQTAQTEPDASSRPSTSNGAPPPTQREQIPAKTATAPPAPKPPPAPTRRQHPTAWRQGPAAGSCHESR